MQNFVKLDAGEPSNFGATFAKPQNTKNTKMDIYLEMSTFLTSV